MWVISAQQFALGFTAGELFIFKVWPLLTVTSQDLFPISCHCYMCSVSPVSHSFRVEEAEVVSPDGQIYKYPVLWLITIEMIVLFRLLSSKISALIPWFVFKELAYRKEKLSGQLINKKIGIK